MNDLENAKIVSSTEIAAALAEAEKEGHIPSLDDGQAREVVAIPVESGLPNRSSSTSGDADISAEPVAMAMPIDTEPSAAPAPPERAVVRSLPYRIADRVLWAINWPFAWLGPSARSMVGLVGIATLAASTTAVLVLPRGASSSRPLDDVHNRAVTALSAKAASQPTAPE
jgi:hypothetical protein